MANELALSETDLTEIYSFFASKFEQSKQTDAYFTVSKIYNAMLAIRPSFDIKN